LALRAYYYYDYDYQHHTAERYSVFGKYNTTSVLYINKGGYTARPPVSHATMSRAAAVLAIYTII
jgi:hypothetical protein